MQGKVLGQHNGIINFTIGQRKGIKVSDKEPLYVLKINFEILADVGYNSNKELSDKNKRNKFSLRS